jgi:ATP adenylyltransferase
MLLTKESGYVSAHRSLSAATRLTVQVEFVVTQTITSKLGREQSLKLEADTPPHEHHHRPQCFGPGSDIAFEDGRLLLAMPSESHLLVFNKFPVFRPQFLLLTVDSYRRQNEFLDTEDLTTAYEMLQSLKVADRDHYAFYNCCREAGSSRDHKHIQIIPRTLAMFPRSTSVQL